MTRPLCLEALTKIAASETLPFAVMYMYGMSVMSCVKVSQLDHHSSLWSYSRVIPPDNNVPQSSSGREEI